MSDATLPNRCVFGAVSDEFTLSVVFHQPLGQTRPRSSRFRKLEAHRDGIIMMESCASMRLKLKDGKSAGQKCIPLRRSDGGRVKGKRTRARKSENPTNPATHQHHLISELFSWKRPRMIHFVSMKVEHILHRVDRGRRTGGVGKRASRQLFPTVDFSVAPSSRERGGGVGPEYIARPRHKLISFPLYPIRSPPILPPSASGATAARIIRFDGGFHPVDLATRLDPWAASGTVEELLKPKYRRLSAL
ncbi:hypothetical protein ZHAS_00010969 [Anopheles sinensis]|uniref:Uncharacterized protein n=1 Tax=Anopheles sinensis TaxID=74873 RepID=A0A084VYZ8_ANOSI|nr:hypothetical protein ZHAS_00010969 [Anopheles sinensis]